MNVGDFFAQLSYGELSDLKMGMEGAGTIADQDRPRIVHHLNHALTQIYSRFAHKIDYVTISLRADTTKYVLKPLDAAENQDGDTIPVEGQTQPGSYFVGAEPNNLIKILSVTLDDPDDDCDPVDLLINDLSSSMSVRTLDYRTILVQNPQDGVLLDIEYQAKHPRLSLPVEMSEEIDIAPVLETALEKLVSARVYSAMNGEANIAKALTLESQYERICQMVADKDLLQLSSSDNHRKFSIGGFI